MHRNAILPSQLCQENICVERAERTSLPATLRLIRSMPCFLLVTLCLPTHFLAALSTVEFDLFRGFFHQPRWSDGIMPDSGYPAISIPDIESQAGSHKFIKRR